MTILSQSGSTTDLTLNGTTAVNALLNKPVSVPSAVYSVLNMDASNVVFIKFGYGSAPAATAADLPIPPGVMVGVEAGVGATHISAVCFGASTAHVYLTPAYIQGRF